MLSTMRLNRLWSRKAALAVRPPDSGVSVGDEVIDHLHGGSRWIVERYVRSRNARPQHVVLRYTGKDERRRLVSERQLHDSAMFRKAPATESFNTLT